MYFISFLMRAVVFQGEDAIDEDTFIELFV